MLFWRMLLAAVSAGALAGCATFPIATSADAERACSAADRACHYTVAPNGMIVRVCEIGSQVTVRELGPPSADSFAVGLARSEMREVRRFHRLRRRAHPRFQSRIPGAVVVAKRPETPRP